MKKRKQMEIKCLFCQKNYVCSYHNTKIVCTTIETKCPLCNKKLTKNLSSFIETQVSDIVPAIQKAVAMQEYSRSLLSEFFGG
jgi:hypothetical protein